MPIETNPVRAVIFDVDGVLVDSYRAHMESWFETMSARGIDFTEADFAASFGRTSRDIIRSYFPEGATLDDATIRAIDDEKEAAYRMVVEHDFPAMPGARELVSALHARSVLIGVGSSGPPENVELVLRKLDVCHLIGAFVTGMDVTRGKPDPQVFLLAAERLGVAPARCLVVEDAPAGVEAAHRAGMACLGLTSTGRTRSDLSGADRIVARFDKITVDEILALID